jgi:putative ABC transport system permease protein
MLRSAGDHLRYAVRALRGRPALLLAATTILALAIAANTTVFSVVDSVLLRPLPYPESERLYWVGEHFDRMMSTGVSVGADYYSIREENHVFEDVAAYDSLYVNWTGGDTPDQLLATQVTPSFFRVMGARPMLGRYLAPGEEGSKAPAAAVLSYSFWRGRLGSDPHIAGKTIAIDGLSVNVLGVMPQGFDYPHGTQIWRPLNMDEAAQRPRLSSRPMRLVEIVARLKPGIGPTALATEMARLAHNLRGEYPADFNTAGFLKGFEVEAVQLQRRLTGDLRPALLVLTGAVALVLLIACVNLANLLLARAGGRRRELAIRLALGAGRAGIIRQMLLESVLLALPGGAAGIAISAIAVAALNRYKPLILDRYPAIQVDLATLGFTIGLTLLTALLFGIAPALSASGVRVLDALKSAGHTQSGSHGAARLRRFLVVAELGVSLVLLIGAGLLARSFLKLAEVPLGFSADHLVAMRLNLTSRRYASGAAQMSFYNDVLDRIRRLPMVRSAAISTDIPLSGGRAYSGMMFQVEGRAPLPMAQRPQADGAMVSPDFFAVMGIPVKAGRIFDEHDAYRQTSQAMIDRGNDPHGAAAAIVVNDAFARRIFPGEDPIGRTILTGQNNRSTIVGVVGGIRGSSLGAEVAPLVYSCACGTGNRFLSRMAIVVRTNGDAESAIKPIEGQVYAVDGDQPVSDALTMEQRLAASLAPQRFQLVLVGAFAILAILLAAAGVYGVMSYLVTCRGREIGIRIALGARPADVARLILREAAWLSALAIAAGLAGGWELTRYANSMLYGISPLDGPSFALAPLVLVLAVLCATAGPAYRAFRVDPIAALQEE